MADHWNLEGGTSVDISDDIFKTAYRAQSYKEGYSEENCDHDGAYGFYNFTDEPNRRFVPSKDTAYYMGFAPLAVFVETNKDFREASVAQTRPMPFGEFELKRTEIIAFTGFGALKLFDLNSSLAPNRHNLRPDSPILVGLDYSDSNLFANEVHAKGYDGILFRTRQGITHAAVVWGRAESKISCANIIYRKSALTLINSIPNAEQLLGILIDKEAD